MEIFKQTLKRLLGSKLKLAIIFICPALFTAMFMTTTKSAITILVVDNDRTALSEMLVSGLGTLDEDIVVRSAKEDGVVDSIVSYQADEALTIPKGFEEAVLRGETPAIEAFYVLEAESVYYAKAYVNSFVADMSALAAGTGNDREAFGRALSAWSEGKLSAESPSMAGESAAAWAYGSLGFLVQFMLYMSIIAAGIILEDRSSGVYYRTFFAPVSLRRYYTENLLAFLLIGILQAVISLTLLMTVFRQDFKNPAAVFLVFTAFAFVCIALGMWIITFFKKPLFAYLATMFLTTPLVMLGGCYWPSSYMPDLVVKIARFLPTSWVMQAADKIINNGATPSGIGLELLVLLLFAGVFMAAGLAKKVDIAK